MNTAITIKKVAEYLGVFNAKGQEVGGIYPGTMNLVMFRQDRGMFESLDAAIEAANAINAAHMNVIGKIEARLSANRESVVISVRYAFRDGVEVVA